MTSKGIVAVNDGAFVAVQGVRHVFDRLQANATEEIASKIARTRDTTAQAASGAATGTWITSMRKYAVLVSSCGGRPEQPASSPRVSSTSMRSSYSIPSAFIWATASPPFTSVSRSC